MKSLASKPDHGPPSPIPPHSLQQVEAKQAPTWNNMELFSGAQEAFPRPDQADTGAVRCKMDQHGTRHSQAHNSIFSLGLWDVFLVFALYFACYLSCKSGIAQFPWVTTHHTIVSQYVNSDVNSRGSTATQKKRKKACTNKDRVWSGVAHHYEEDVHCDVDPMQATRAPIHTAPTLSCVSTKGREESTQNNAPPLPSPTDAGSVNQNVFQNMEDCPEFHDCWAVDEIHCKKPWQPPIIHTDRHLKIT